MHAKGTGAARSGSAVCVLCGLHTVFSLICRFSRSRKQLNPSLDLALSVHLKEKKIDV